MIEPGEPISPSLDAGFGAGNVASLGEDIRVRVLNCSATGCLFESNKHLRAGTVAALRFVLDGRTYNDMVIVVRCEAPARRQGAYVVAAELLSQTPAEERSIRHLMRSTAGGHAARLARGCEDDRTNICSDPEKQNQGSGFTGGESAQESKNR